MYVCGVPACVLWKNLACPVLLLHLIPPEKGSVTKPAATWSTTSLGNPTAFVPFGTGVTGTNGYTPFF